jgi:hypothetical protein
MHSIILLNILLLIGAFRVCSSASSEFYDKFRAIFGSVATLQPYDIDQITSQLLNQVNCTQNLGADCFNVIKFTCLVHKHHIVDIFVSFKNSA